MCYQNTHHKERRPVGADQTEACEGRNLEETLEMDWPHTPKTGIQYHKASPNLEPPGEEEKRSAEKHLAPGFGGRHQEDGTHLGTAGETGSGPGWLEDSCGRPLSRMGPQAVMMMMMMMMILKP